MDKHSKNNPKALMMRPRVKYPRKYPIKNPTKNLTQVTSRCAMTIGAAMHTGMVNGRSITSWLSVGLLKHEIRHPIGSVRLEVKLEPIPSGSGEFNIGFRSDIKTWKPI
jgi:hypothetical protein